MNEGSSLYTGTIEHRRLLPRKHEFSYRVSYFFLDLDEIPQIFRLPFLFSYNSPGLFSFWRKDYFPTQESSLKEAISSYVSEQTAKPFKGKIKLLTNISYFGYCFNPVSFYYCYDESGEGLLYVVSEITNTPWKERHRQLFTFEEKGLKTFHFPKSFHVSPFMPMEIDYTWAFHRPGENLKVFMQNRKSQESELLFDSTLQLKKVPLTKKSILWFLFRSPFMTFKTSLAIHLQAFLLYLKHIPVFDHPKNGRSL